MISKKFNTIFCVQQKSSFKKSLVSAYIHAVNIDVWLVWLHAKPISMVINAKSNPKYIRTITQEVILCNANISSDAPMYCFVLCCPVLGIWTLEVAMDTPLCIGTIYIYTTMYKHYIHVHRAYMHLCVNHSMVCPRDFEVACAFTRFFEVVAEVVWPWCPSPCDRSAFFDAFQYASRQGTILCRKLRERSKYTLDFLSAQKRKSNCNDTWMKAHKNCCCRCGCSITFLLCTNICFEETKNATCLSRPCSYVSLDGIGFRRKLL